MQGRQVRRRAGARAHFFLERLPSVTLGGLFWDVESPKSVNLCHFGIWGALFALPLTLSLSIGSRHLPKLWAAAIYTGAVTLFFVVVKISNFAVHSAFDARAMAAAMREEDQEDEGTSGGSNGGRGGDFMSEAEVRARKKKKKDVRASRLRGSREGAFNRKELNEDLGSRVAAAASRIRTPVPQQVAEEDNRDRNENEVGGTRRRGLTKLLKSPFRRSKYERGRLLGAAESPPLPAAATAAATAVVSDTEGDEERLPRDGRPSLVRGSSLTNALRPATAQGPLETSVAQSATCSQPSLVTEDAKEVSRGRRTPDRGNTRGASEDDTSVVHTFVDENGEVHCYSFKTPPRSPVPRRSSPPAAPAVPPNTTTTTADVRSDPETGLLDDVLPDEEDVTEDGRPRLRLPLLGTYFTREELLKLFDRNETLVGVLSSILLAAGSAYITYSIQDYYQGFTLIWFWIVVTGAHYSLLKAPQPDSFSPSIEGGVTMSFTRAFYLIIISGLVLSLSIVTGVLDPSTLHFASSDGAAVTEPTARITMFGYVLDEVGLLRGLRWLFWHFILWFPQMYLFGTLPQMDTGIFYVIEQSNIILFGCSGSPSTKGALFEFFRSVLTCTCIAWTCVAGQHSRAAFSVFAALIVALSYINSKMVNDPSALLAALRQLSRDGQRFSLWSHLRRSRAEYVDYMDGPRPRRIVTDYSSVRPLYPPHRLVFNVFMGIVLAAIFFGLDVTGFFRFLNRHFSALCNTLAILLGLAFDVFLPRLRHAFPFNLYQKPILANNTKNAQPMWFERFLLLSRMVQNMIVYPTLLLGYIENDVPVIVEKAGLSLGVVLVALCSYRAMRATFTDVSRNHLFLIFTLSFFTFDFGSRAECFTINYFIGSIIVLKLDELISKLNYLFVYTSPWRLSWGSTTHALLQPLSFPHTAFTLWQVLTSTLLSLPLYPLLGAVWFLASYPRPVKYWEKTRRVVWNDVSNTPLHVALAHDHTPSNPDATFYYHLLCSLQKTLNRDIEAGRFGSVHTGDFFLLANDTLTAILHIVSIGNGYTTFQLRGLELQGTLCQELELAAVQESGTNLGRNCCFPKPLCRLPLLLSFRDSMSFRWKTWRVVNTAFHINTYTIALLPAASMFNLFSLRQVLVKMFVSAIIFYLIGSPSMEMWLQLPEFASVADSFDESFVERDSVFCHQIDADFDKKVGGVTFRSFRAVYGSWIAYCLEKRAARENRLERSAEDLLARLLFRLSLLSRRVLVLNKACVLNTTLFLQRFHSLLGGDFRITSPQDEWILADVALLDSVVSSAVKISLRLHQAHVAGEDINEPETLYAALCQYQTELVVCREDSPEWREAIIGDPPVPQLLSLRKQKDPQAGDQFYVVYLSLRTQPFTLVRLNRECVRGLWAGQQQELVYFGNANAERGSIQQLSSVLRNIVNQACDPPVGYPVFVSELTTSYTRFWPDVWRQVPVHHSLKRALGWVSQEPEGTELTDIA